MNKVLKGNQPAPAEIPVPAQPSSAQGPGSPSCQKCKGTGRAIFIEPTRKLRTVGPCECVKA
jgi:hypothetical protein